MIKGINLNYSTTKLCYKLVDHKYLDENGRVKEKCKFRLSFSEFEIVNSKIPAKEDEKFDTYLFLPEGEGRKGEGGLRTKGYFKFSYEKKDGKWSIVKDDKFIKEVDLDENLVKDYEKLPLITIITVVFNGEKYLEETIQSVVNQTYPNVEYIIIDGGSTDGTVDIIKKYEDYIDYWVSEKDYSMYHAINKGLTLSLGKIIASLNSDDMYHDQFVLSDVKRYFEKHKDIDGLYGKIAKLYNEKQVTKSFFQVNSELLLISQHSTFMPQPTLFLKNSIYKNNHFDLQYKYASDYDFNLRILNNYNIKYFNRVITVFRQHRESISSSGKLDSERKKILFSHGLYRINVFKRVIMFYILWIKYKIFNTFK